MNRFPIKVNERTLMWADPDDVALAALDQLANVAALPWVEALRVMPDVHYGMGATVGSVIAMRDAVSPSAVGVDIGCGMRAVQTSLTVQDLPDSLGPLRASIEAAVPVGFDSHDEPARIDDAELSAEITGHMRRFGDLFAGAAEGRISRAGQQLGTLGGGNHFIELCADQDGRIWIMLHSGSRNIGKELAEWHINEAKQLRHNLDLPDRDLAVFLAETDEMARYMHDLHWAQEYARLNRAVMMNLVKGALVEHFPDVTFAQEVQCHHNYVAEERYDHLDVIVTRKGAIRAGAGELGLIPGSMGTGSYVVRGLGNPASLQSASHGAGRRMSRRQAKKRFSLDDLAAQTAGVEVRKDAGVLDEIPGAYKDLDAVIRAQTEGPSPLVEVVTKLDTLLCVKG